MVRKPATFLPIWRGETIFIIAGGTSVARQDLSLLNGRRVIVVNSSYETYPQADALYFGDRRWWELHRNRPALAAFKGMIVTSSEAAAGGRLLKGKRLTPAVPHIPGIATNRQHLVGVRTSLQAAVNLAFHFGDFVNPDVKHKRLVLLGADMARDAEGKTHHHAPHPWHNKAGNKTWDMQMVQFQTAVAPLKQFGVEVINTSDTTRIPWWPIRPLQDVVANEPSLPSASAQ